MLKPETFTTARYLNQRNVFSHSRQCDDFFETISALPGGIEHQGCNCWCHGTGDSEALFESDTGPEYDLTPPPEYATTADIYEETHTRGAGEIDAKRTSEVTDSFGADVDPFQPDTVSPVKYPGRSRQEITRNKCDTCGDSLNKCECVE